MNKYIKENLEFIKDMWPWLIMLLGALMIGLIAAFAR